MRRALSICLPLATFAVIAAAWQMLATYGGFPPKLVPGLGKIAEAFLRLAGDGTLLAAAFATLYRLGAGFLIAAVIGVSTNPGLISMTLTPAGQSRCRRPWVKAPRPALALP